VIQGAKASAVFAVLYAVSMVSAFVAGSVSRILSNTGNPSGTAGSSIQSQPTVTTAATPVLSAADMARQESLDFPLDLVGEMIVQDRGYWVKMEARRRDPSPQVPHGIGYPLTLRDK
jgi:hypothetical protein